jgi:hypothetical protein
MTSALAIATICTNLKVADLIFDANAMYDGVT